MDFRLVKRRSIWCPTLLGWVCLLALGTAPGLWWWFKAESFFSLTERQPADVLVLEAWIGNEGVRAAAAEFQSHGYRYIVAAGGYTGERWQERRWSYVEMAERELMRAGVPKDKIIGALSRDTEIRRTFESAAAVARQLQSMDIHPKAVNVFTRGSHARRSRLVFAKALGQETKVGVISWLPPEYDTEPWWHSSDRADDVIKETVGYLFELFLNSGRRHNSPATTSDSRAHFCPGAA
jgi:uncharacterized SAM-binding protein YcdF (DUF218 family)